MEHKKSSELFIRANNVMPGGVNSPVRSFRAVGMNPLFVKRAFGSKITDADDNEYIDYVGSWGPLILGHAHPSVIEAVGASLGNGLSFGAATEKEIELAELICEAVPSIEMVRLVNSGTEAVMSAIRLARGYAKRDKILKFEGCYHGHSDGMLVKAGSGALTYGTPDSDGVPFDIAKNTIVAPYNDCDRLEEIFRVYGHELAAAIMEPVAGNMGVVLPGMDFLQLLRRLTGQYGSLLIFDEVITGFRLAYGGAQEYFGILPDITVLGKIIGGGMPIGAYGASREIMKMISPSGSVYQAGTLSGNPVAVTAGISTIKTLKNNAQIYVELDNKSKQLEEAYIKSALKYHIPITVNRIGSMMTVFFNTGKVVDYKTATRSDTGMFAEHFANMLENGIFVAPSQYEANFVSCAHSDDDILKTIASINNSFAMLCV